MRILIIILLSASLAYTQNIEPWQRKFTLNGTQTYLSSQSDYFKLNKFTLGWHWGDEPKITKSLFMNQKDIDSDTQVSDMADSLLLFIRSIYRPDASTQYYLFTHCYFDNNPAFGKSLCYDPALYIDPNNPYCLPSEFNIPNWHINS